MSVISIRPAAERLQNLGDLRRPDRMPHFVAPDMSGQKAMARSYGDLGRGVAHFGSALADIAVAMKKEDEDRRLAAAGAEYQRRLQAGFLEGDDPIMARQGDALEGEGLKKTQGDTQQLFTTSFDEVCTRYGIDGRLKEKFALHVAPVALSWNGRMDSHVMAERQKNAITAADATVAADEATWAGDRFNAGMTKKLLDDYDHKLKVRGATEEVRAVEVRKYALGLAAGIARSSLDGIDSEGAFDEKIRLMKEDPDGMFNDNAELRERLGKNALPKETVDLLVGEAKMRREQFIREQTKAVNDQVDALVVEGDLGKMDKGVDDLRKSADAMKEGGRVRTATLEAAAKLDKAADAEARRLDWEAIVADDGAGKYKPPEDPRMAKFHAALKASYEEQKGRYYAGAFAAEDAARREERKSTEIALRVNMLASAQLAPGEFSARLADAAAKGDISLGQYHSLRDEFEDVWQKEGMPRKAAALVDVLKREFFAGKDYDLSERLGVNPKTGRFEYGRNPDTKKPYEGEDAEYKTTELVPVKNRATLYGSFVADNSGRTRSVTTTNTLTSNEQMQLLNRMMELAKHDGEDTYIDPLTKEVLSSPRKIDAVDEFQRLCSMIKTEKRTEAATSVVDRVCDAMLAVDGGWRRFEDRSVESAARRESAEVAARAATRQARRGSFKPKMPTSAGGAKAGLPEDENMED